jgi:hypothetical protein
MTMHNVRNDGCNRHFRGRHVGRYITGQIKPDGLNWADGQPRRDLPRFCRRGHKKEGFFRIVCFGGRKRDKGINTFKGLYY